MWDFIKEVFTSLVQAGWPLDVIVGIGIFILALYIFFYFKRANNVQNEYFEKLTQVLEKNTELAEGTNNLIKAQSDHIAKENSLINELHNSVTALSYNI